MDRTKSIPFVLIILLTLFSGKSTQELSVEETVEYINDAIEKDDYYGKKKDQLEFKVDEEGDLTAQYYWGTYEAFEHEMSLKDLAKDSVGRDTSTLYDRDIIKLNCAETDHCITKEFTHKHNSYTMGTYEFSITTNRDAGRRVQNAFSHLIEQAELEFDDAEKKDGDDPFGR